MLKSSQRLMALRHVASQISSNEDLDDLLHDLVRSAVQQDSWDLGSVMSIDLDHGYGLVITRFETSILPQHTENRWELATSPSLIALQKNEPVYIRDALESTQFPGYRNEAKERGYRTVLVLPMSSKDAQNRPMVLSVASRSVRDMSEDDLTFISTVVHLGSIAIERAHRERVQHESHQHLQNALEAQRRLLRDVLAGGSIEHLTSTLADLLSGPVLVIDFFANHLVGARSPVPDSLDDAGWQRWLSSALGRETVAVVRESIQRYRQMTVELALTRTLNVRASIEPLKVDDELVGALLTFGHDGTSDLHQLMLESARFALSVQMMRSVVRFRFETRTLTELFFEVVERRWRDKDDILRRGRHLGLSLELPMRMLVVDFSDQGGSTDASRPAKNLSLEGHGTVDLLARQMNMPIHIVTVGSGLVCLMPQESVRDTATLSRFAKRVSDALNRALGQETIVAIGEVFEGIEPLAGEWERCWRMIRVARKFGRSGPLDIQGLGPLPMLMGAADSADILGFVDGTIGSLIKHDRQSGSPYLETLVAYLRSGCRYQPCADAMGLHVTTLRYRLSRIQELFGIDVESPERRFAVELAIQLHTLASTGGNASASMKTLPN